jgi:CCR4-NOT transcription complex subunit 9
MENTPDIDRIHELVHNLINPETRPEAMEELGKMRDIPNASELLAVILWHSYGSIAALVQEVVCLYPLLSYTKQIKVQANRTCNALALLQCVAAHNDTRVPFFQSGIVMFLFPILNTVTKQNPFELLRLTSLGVIGALVKTDDPEVIHFLLNTELILLCLRIMDIGLDLSKTLAVFILQKILTDDAGLAFVCSVPNRLQLVSEVFCKVIKMALPKSPLPVENNDQRKRLFKHIIRCFCRLVDDPNAVTYLRTNIPVPLVDGNLANFFRDDANVAQILTQLRDSLDPEGRI